MNKTKTTVSLVVIAILASSLPLASARADTPAEATKRITIPAGDLNTALESLVRQTGVQLLYDLKTVERLQTRGAQGDLTAEQAATRLLEGTALELRSDPSGALLIAPKSTDAQEQPQTTAALEEVVVTGSHIRGNAPAGSKLVVIDRQAITDSGYGRLQDVVETLTQVTGSPGEDNVITNLSRSQGISLRGAGAGSTLVLVNGRRQPGGDLEGSFVDISSIPASAVERVEVLADGASALYGSDAVGGVVNFILRKDYEGFETSARVAAIESAGDEIQLSQLFGQSWDAGNVLVGYEYSFRDALACADGFYCSRNQDFRSLGGSDLRAPHAVPGTILNPSTGAPAFAIPAGQDGSDLAVADLFRGQNYFDSVSGVARLPEQKLHAAFLTASHRLTERVELFADARFGRREMTLPHLPFNPTLTISSTHPNYINPFGGTAPVRVAYHFGATLGNTVQHSETTTYAVSAGGKLALAGQWGLTTTLSAGRDKTDWDWINNANADRRTRCLTGLASSGCPGAPINPFGDTPNDPRTLDFIRSTQLGSGDYTTHSATAIADGPLFDLPAGTVRLAIGADYRDEELDAFRGELAPATGVFTPAPSNTIGKLDRQVAAVFGELVLPLLSESLTGRAGMRLDLSVAGRFEDYSDFGQTTNPKLGLSFAPLRGLTLRGTWGSSFRAPTFREISPSVNPPRITSITVDDPASPVRRSNVLQLQGANPDLHEETADTWTAGVDFSPTVIDGLNVSATYFDLDYQDKIAMTNAGTALARPDVWGRIITRNPTQAQVDALCRDPTFDSQQCLGNTVAIVDARLQNLGGLHVSGLDFDVSYRQALPAGVLRSSIGGTRLYNYETAVTADAPFVGTLDTAENPVSLRLRGIVGYELRQWQVQAAVNYTDDYSDPSTSLAIASWTTVDATLSYTFDRGWLEDTHVQLSAVNVLDEEAPFRNFSGGYDRFNASDIGRSVSFSLRKQWGR